MDFTSKQLLKMLGALVLVCSVIIIIKNNAQDNIYADTFVTSVNMENDVFEPFDLTLLEDLEISEYIDTELFAGNVSFNEDGYYDISVNTLPDFLVPKIESATPTLLTASSETSISTAKRYIVSRKAKKYDKNSVYLDIRTVLQLPELPVGCEATSLTMVLNYYGFDAEKTDVAKNYLPQSTYYKEKNDKVYINNYNNFFYGDPFGKGYGCFSNCIVKTANNYIKANGGGYKAKNISDSSVSDLLKYVAKGTPVICWGTVDMQKPFYTQKFYDIKTDEDITWIAKEHCFVLVGFNLEDRTVTINDPLSGIITHDLDLFATRYKQLRKNAVILEKTSSKTTSKTTITTTLKTTTTTTTTESTTNSTTKIPESTETTTSGSLVDG